MSNPRFGQVFVRPSLGFRCIISSNGQLVLILIILNLTFSMQWFSIPLNHVCASVAGDFHVSTDTLVQNVVLIFWFQTLLVRWHWTCLWHRTYGLGTSSLTHFGHFLLIRFGHWNISVICLTVVSKVAVAVFINLYFQIFWPKWLYFFRSFQKCFGLWPKKQRRE